MVFLELLRVNDAEVAPYLNPIGMALIRPLKVLVLFLREVGHGALELSDNSARSEGPGRENAKFGLASAVRVTRRVSNLDGPVRRIKLEIAGSMTIRSVSE